MTLIKLLKTILLAQGNNNMKTDDNAQLCENEEIIDESIDKNKEMPLKKESENVIEFYDVYP